MADLSLVFSYCAKLFLIRNLGKNKIFVKLKTKRNVLPDKHHFAGC